MAGGGCGGNRLQDSENEVAAGEYGNLIFHTGTHSAFHKKEDIIAGLCKAVVTNYLNNVGKSKKIAPPIVCPAAFKWREVS